MRAIDLFAGAGGFSCGAEMAGLQLVWAANHWPKAVNTYELNHGLKPYCQDLQQANWLNVPEHDILLASPACQGHSIAKGKDRPHHDATRSTAWAVVSCLETHKTPVAIVENVPEFLKWSLYPAWKNALELLGYQIAPTLIDSADHSVPQNRNRIFLVITRSKAPLFLNFIAEHHQPISNVIQWDKYQWQKIVKPGRSQKTIDRWKNGLKNLGTDRFVMPFYGSGSGLTGRSIDRPIGTITTRDRWALVQGDELRMLQVDENKAAMGFPADFILPDNKADAMMMLGNAVCPPVARDLINEIRRVA